MNTVLARHVAQNPCPVCGGHSGLPQGVGERCAGFSLDRVCFCTREELAGRLPVDGGTMPPSYKHLLVGSCGCGHQHGRRTQGHVPSHRPSATARRHTLSIEETDRVYSTALDLLAVPGGDEEGDLLRRGLSAGDILQAGYRSIPRTRSDRRVFMETMKDLVGELVLRRCPGFTDKNGRLSFWYADWIGPGYVVSYRDERGRINGLQLKVVGGKYLNASGATPKLMYHVAGDPVLRRDLYVTEGGLKAEVAARKGLLWVMGVPGLTLSAEHLLAIHRLAPDRVIVALDEEVNANTDRARERWLRLLWEAGHPTYRATWGERHDCLQGD